MRFGNRGSIAAALVILAVLTLSPRLVAQQAKAAASQPSSREIARTPWAEPDLQGIYNSLARPPFQRPRPGEKPPANEEDGPPVGAPGNAPVLKDVLGNPTNEHQTGNGPEHWYEWNLDLPTGQAS